MLSSTWVMWPVPNSTWERWAEYGAERSQRKAELRAKGCKTHQILRAGSGAAALVPPSGVWPLLWGQDPFPRGRTNNNVHEDTPGVGVKLTSCRSLNGFMTKCFLGNLPAPLTIFMMELSGNFFQNPYFEVAETPRLAFLSCPPPSFSSFLPFSLFFTFFFFKEKTKSMTRHHAYLLLLQETLLTEQKENLSDHFHRFSHTILLQTPSFSLCEHEEEGGERWPLSFCRCCADPRPREECLNPTVARHSGVKMRPRAREKKSKKAHQAKGENKPGAVK